MSNVQPRALESRLREVERRLSRHRKAMWSLAIVAMVGLISAASQVVDKVKATKVIVTDEKEQIRVVLDGPVVGRRRRLAIRSGKCSSGSSNPKRIFLTIIGI